LTVVTLALTLAVNRYRVAFRKHGMTDQISKEHIAYLSQSALAFVDVEPEADLYLQIAELLKGFLGNAIVFVSAYDAAAGVLEQRATAGLSSRLLAIGETMGIRPSPMKMSANPEALAQIETGRLSKIEEGLYELCLRKVPKAVTQAVERLANIRECYGMGCVAGGRCFGAIMVCLRGDTVLPPVEVVETFVYQAAVALKRREAETALRQSEARYRMLMEHASDPYLITDCDGHIIEINASATTALGYSQDDLSGKHISDLLDPEELAANPLRWDLILKQETVANTRRVRPKTGSQLTFEVHSSPLPDGHVFFSARDITRRRRLEKAVVEAGERERRMVGRDLHDSLGQQLAAVGYVAAALERHLLSAERHESEAAGQIAALVREAVGQTRRMAHGLCPVDMSEEGFIVALEQLGAQLKLSSGVECVLDVEGPPASIAQETALHLYQIAQEAANNAIHHGRATKLTFSVFIDAARGKLIIRDNGGGIAVELENADGFGLRAMRYRAEMLDGTLSIESGREGTAITCSFPCPS
jgi:two-component system, LuxR family, sensor kinase FixL